MGINNQAFVEMGKGVKVLPVAVLKAGKFTPCGLRFYTFFYKEIHLIFK